MTNPDAGWISIGRQRLFTARSQPTSRQRNAESFGENLSSAPIQPSLSIDELAGSGARPGPEADAERERARMSGDWKIQYSVRSTQSRIENQNYRIEIEGCDEIVIYAKRKGSPTGQRSNEIIDV